MSVIDEIKNRIDIVDLVSETVKLRKSGKNYTGFCPFHDNKRTPAFAVFPDSGTWRCFGQCNEGGDIFKFVMKKEGWDFPETLQYLANKAGIELEPQTPEKIEEEQVSERLRDLLEEAVIFFRHNLRQNMAGQKALEYLEGRGVRPETMDLFELGYAPDSWDACYTHFLDKNVPVEDLLAIGLLSERQSGEGFYDRFRNRLMFPIRDGMGKMAGFGARALVHDDVPKYLNSPQTDFFDKGKLLYGIHLARKNIRSQNQAVIVEGYLDVIIPHQAGFATHVSPMGTALTEDQLRQLKRYSRNIILALDPDSAGEKATWRGLEVARQVLDHSSDIQFDARGLLQQESRLKADLRVATLPDGMDPDEIVLRNEQEWQDILQQAKPIVLHVIETLTSGSRKEDPKVKAEIVAKVLPLIEDVPNVIERDAYRQRLARILQIDERVLLGAKTRKSFNKTRPYKKNIPQTISVTEVPVVQGKLSDGTYATERTCLQLLLRDPEAIYMVNRVLQKAELERFASKDFMHSAYQQIAQILLDSLEQDQMDPKAYMLDHRNPGIEEVMDDLLSPIPEGEPTQNHLVKYLVHAFLRLRQMRSNEELKQIRYICEDLSQLGQSDMEEYREREFQYIRTRARIDKIIADPLQLD